MPHLKDSASNHALALGGVPEKTDISVFNLTLTMPPAELRGHVANIIAQGLYQAKLPWLPGEKIVATDLEGVASFVIGALMGLERAANDGKAN